MKTDDFTCPECGKTVKIYDKAGTVCYRCQFWLLKAQNKDHPDFVRCRGWHYIIGDDKNHVGERGFAGRTFTIKFKDGRVVTTSNLWGQGEIPERFRERLPDNAEFSYIDERTRPYGL